MHKPEIESKTLLLVAGPSGAGKTVLITQFRAGKLDPGIRKYLPDKAEAWPQIGANDCMKRGVGIEAVLPRDWSAPGGVVHYDTAYIHRFGLTRYEQDPIAELFDTAGRLIIVSISPSAAALKAQFDDRRARQLSDKKPSHLFWKTYVRRPIEKTINRLKRIDPRETRELYQDPEWVNRCTAAWTDFARRLVSRKPGSRLIVLKPVLDTQGNETFGVISDD